MLKRKPRKPIGNRAHAKRRRKIFVAAGLILILTVGGGALAQWSGLYSVTQKGGQKAKEIAPAALTPTTPSREYIYVGGRLLAIEEP